MEQKYNGWSNYPTWNYKLWLDNEEGSYNYWRGRVTELLSSNNGAAESAARDLAGELESELEENTPTTTGVYADLLNFAMGSIDYREIAEAMVADFLADHPQEAAQKEA